MNPLDDAEKRLDRQEAQREAECFRADREMEKADLPEGYLPVSALPSWIKDRAPAAGSREAATDPPTGLTNPKPDASSSPVPVPVVNEVAEEFWKAWSDPDRDFNMADVEDITKTFLSLPTVKAALAALTVADAHRKIIALQAVERDEAQAKLEAAEASLRMAHEVLSITTNYLLGQGEGEGRDPDECRALATNEALAGFERLDAVLLPVEEGGESS